MPVRCVVLVLGLAFLFFTGPWPVAAAGPGLPEDDPAQPWHITADKITRDQKTGDLIASGHVIVTKQGNRIEAEKITFNQVSGDIRAEGNVVLATGQDLLTGSQVALNLHSRKGVIDNGTLFISANHFYIKGDRIIKTGTDSYTVEQPALTSCDGEKPDWKITGKKLDVTIEGYGYITNAALRAGSVPVFYSPFLAFPAKTKRQSGLLAPQFGTSRRKGFEYIQPVYWAINDQSDATFMLHHMEDRGEKIGAEYRYVLNEASLGTAMADGFSDRRTDDGTETDPKWGFEDDGLARTNRDRYWFRMKHDHRLPYGITAKLDLDLVSDQDYLKEFNSGYTGFEDTDDYYTKAFGRGLDPIDETVRENQLSFNKTGSTYSLSADLRWNDNVVNRQNQAADTTLQTLPRVSYTATKQSLWDTPYFFDAAGGFVYFYRQTGARGNRVDIHPRIYYPITWGNYLSFEPSLGTHATAWYMDSTESTSLARDDYFRNIYDIKLDTSSEIFRVFSGNRANGTKIRHTAIPRVVYNFIPIQDQNDLPYFEASDRIAAQNIITYSVTNQLTSRTAKKQRPQKPGAPVYDYDQFCRLELGQSYDINRARFGHPEPFLPIYADLELNPGRKVSLKADAEWSVYADHFVSHNIGMGLNNDRADRLDVEYRFERYKNESLYANLKVKLTSKVAAYSHYERNIREKRDIGTGLGFIYQSQCWSLDISCTTSATDRRYAFLLNLTGLGGLGTDM